ncbi:phBC6A51 family helix-turn-helix protein [Paenibacillus sp. IHB B 3084]|uniref:phBC6A51 family helix-turn-helix protein n=1 Tax=Paenibacillus sp. IHB B 3084 TaxID=867076 RepID=UPI0010719AF5|nr:phBC6A51 family helix-turn-helix protein [Paenibacillus sp. IHB B 3084]
MNKRSSRRLPLSDIHYAAIALLSDVKRPSHKEIARRLGITRMTLYRYRKRPDFQRELKREIKRRTEELMRENRGRARVRAARDIEWFFRESGLS